MASFGKRSAIYVVLGLILVASIVLAALVYKSVDRELTDVTQMRRASVANLAAATLSEKFARLVDIGLSFANRARFRELVGRGEWAGAMQTLGDVPREFPIIGRVFLADAEGTLMAGFPELVGARGQNLAYDDWYKGATRGRSPYVSQVYTTAAAPALNVFAVVMPIATQGGVTAGFLVLQVHLDRTFFEWTSEMDVGPEGGAYIVDQGGHVAFDSKPHAPGELIDLSATPVVRQLLQGKEGVRIAMDPVTNEETIFAYASAEPYGWGVVMHQPARTSLGLLARDHELRRLSAAYALLLALGISMAYLSYRTVVQRRNVREHVLAHAELETRVAERTMQLEAANTELEAFSYSVSHDLRGPLRSMDGFSLLLIEDYGDKLDDEGKDALGRIRAASQRMGHLIDDLLRLSHVTRAEFNVTRVDLSALAAEIAATLAREEPARSVEMQIEPDLSVRADPALMGIAMRNLLQNAWKFTGRTKTAVIRVGALERDGMTSYFVADNGVGFDMAHAKNLFGAFQRLHHVGDFPGTGIGLAIVRRIIGRHGGETWAQAGEGEGATFFFTIKQPEGDPHGQDNPPG